MIIEVWLPRIGIERSCNGDFVARKVYCGLGVVAVFGGVRMVDLTREEAQVISFIDKNRDNIVEFTQECIRKKSVNPVWDKSGEEATFQQWLYEQFRHWGCFDEVDLWEVEKGRPNVVGVVRGSKSQGALMFNGHSDTVPVPADSRSQWIDDPWSGEIRDGRIYGRGSADMKGGIAAMAWAMRALRDAAVEPKSDVFLGANIGEESGDHKIGCDALIDRGYRPKFVITGEPTNMEIGVATPGIFWLRLIVEGKASHIGVRYRSIYPQPWNVEIPAVGAIDKMIRFLNALSELEREWGLYKKHKLMPPGFASLTPTHISGGQFVGSISERCEAVYGVWLYPDERIDDVMREIRGVVEAVSMTDHYLRDHPPKCEMPYLLEPWLPIEVPADHPACVCLEKAFESVLGRKPRRVGMPFVTDLSWMKTSGIQGMIFGPGEISQAHAVNENISISQLIDCCKTYALMMIRWPDNP